MRLGFDAGILTKDAMRHFWKIANRAFIACAGKIFWESPGKNMGTRIMAGVEIFAEGISLRGGKPITDILSSRHF
jgi:hypothetical protein